MTHIKGEDYPQFRVGLGGNHYVWCLYRQPVVDIAHRIGRSPSGVYWREDFGVWALRVRNGKQKALLKALFNKQGGQQSIDV